MAIPARVIDTLEAVGQVAAEVPGSHEDVRGFVTVFRFRRDSPGVAERYAYLGPREFLYTARRFQVLREVLDGAFDVREEELLDSQRVVLPDDAALEFVLRLWLADLEQLVEPCLTDVPI